MLAKTVEEILAPNAKWIIGKNGLMNVHAHVCNGKTKVDPKSWRIPYQWEGVHYQDHDDEPYLLLINSGGGLVEGDSADFNAVLDADSRLLVTSTEASKFCKCLEGGTARETATIKVGPRALFEYCPDETIPFAWTCAERITRIMLDSTSRLFATDMISAGRVHYLEGEVFKFSSLLSEFEIRIDGHLFLLDRIVARNESEIEVLQRFWNGAYHMASVYGYAPDLPADIENAVHEQVKDVEDTEVGVTRINNLVIVRILSRETWQAKEAMYNCWVALRPAIAGKPARPIIKC